MSVAFELEYETTYPALRVLPGGDTSSPATRRQWGWIALVVVALGLVVALILPIRSLGGRTLAGSAPTAGQVYIVQNGDTLASIAARADATDATAMRQRLAAEIGSSTVVPGEHILIP